MSGPARRFLVPEIVQSSSMDCGPAALSALVEGLGHRASYGRLREACQTDVDGTSIDTLEEIACSLGLNAEQVMLPIDHALMKEAQTLPAIAVAQLPNGSTHFVVIWRTWGGLAQVMDPAVGRLWIPVRKLQNVLYQHRLEVDAAAWREWAQTDGCIAPLTQQLRVLGIAAPRHWVMAALADSSWKSIAALDAAVRMVAALVSARGVRRGAAVTKTFRFSLCFVWPT